MRTKVATIAAAGILGSTLALTPVFANAASLITGADIKNGSITTKHIKDHTLKLHDF